MNRFAIAGAVSTLICCVAAAPLAAQKSVTGEWRIGPSPEVAVRPGALYIMLAIPGGNSYVGLHVRPEELQGLPRESRPDGPVRFRLSREAGTLVFDGSLHGDRGTGTFTFSADPGYAAELARRGIGQPTPHQQLSLAAHDVDLAFVGRIVRDLSEQRSALPDAADLVRLRAVDSAYIRDLAALGYRGLAPDQLARLHRHGVSVEYVREMQALGYRRVPPDQLVRLRNRRVTPEFVRQANAGRSTRRSLEELVRLRDLDRRG